MYLPPISNFQSDEDCKLLQLFDEFIDRKVMLTDSLHKSYGPKHILLLVESFATGGRHHMRS